MDLMTLMAVALADWIKPAAAGSAEEGEVGCRERLGGLLRYYHRNAA